MDACDCEPSCYKCLRNYYNQKIHEHLNRKAAATFLRSYTANPEEVAELLEAEEDIEVFITESIPLSDDYSTWGEAESLFDNDKIIIIKTLGEYAVPLAEFCNAQLEVGAYTFEAFLGWEFQQVAICESITPKAEEMFANGGWTVMGSDTFDIEQLKQKLGGEDNG
jgi:hypothetical protein